MKKAIVKSICHDLLEQDWKNPLWEISVRKEYHINLLTGEKSKNEDDISRMLDGKRDWFLQRIKNLGADIEDFQKAVMRIHNNLEEVEIIYKEKRFFDMRDYRSEKESDESFGKAMKKLRKEIKKDKIKK